ncbi:MAG: hypothetical protein CM15mP120_23860 [Pseudomonadota bacterium]|nr:MAG: hypothetical protein CM15mP120_23860 [Pseudomonadota bacterium]
MDSHFAASLASENLPLTWALAGIWNYNVLNCQSLAVLSYDQRLRLLPDYLQQLEMESNGKSVDRHGKPSLTAPCPYYGAAAALTANTLTINCYIKAQQFLLPTSSWSPTTILVYPHIEIG